MFIRLATGQFSPDQFEDLRRFAQERLASVLGALPGFRSYTAGFDRETGHFIGVSVWDTEEQARAASEAVAQVRAEFPASQRESMLPPFYEVIAQA